MLKALGISVLLAAIVMAVVGMAGVGPTWVRLVGSGTVVLLLLVTIGYSMETQSRFNKFSDAWYDLAQRSGWYLDKPSDDSSGIPEDSVDDDTGNTTTRLPN